MLCNNMAPVRLSCMRTASNESTPLHPHECQEEKCKLDAKYLNTPCEGNRLVIDETQVYSSTHPCYCMRPPPPSTSLWSELLVGPGLEEEYLPYEEVASLLIPSQLPIHKLVLPHHKMDKIHKMPVLTLELPYDLAITTYLYRKHALPVLLEAGGARHNKLWVTTTGKPMIQDQSLNR
jgi:hypothetical protein